MKEILRLIVFPFNILYTVSMSSMYANNKLVCTIVKLEILIIWIVLLLFLYCAVFCIT